MEWYYARASQQFGPVAEQQLTQMVAAGQLRADDLVWCQGMTDWQPLASVPHLAAQIAGGLPPTVPPYHSSTRLTAGVLAILLGGLGVHKFYLGMTVPGLILLLCSIFSCLAAIPLTGLIGLIEGIVYLSKSDAEFYQTYIVEKRPWF
jgi:TM2 domain-containing membrane protein YozV